MSPLSAVDVAEAAGQARSALVPNAGAVCAARDPLSALDADLDPNLNSNAAVGHHVEGVTQESGAVAVAVLNS